MIHDLVALLDAVDDPCVPEHRQVLGSGAPGASGELAEVGDALFTRSEGEGDLEASLVPEGAEDLHGVDGGWLIWHGYVVRYFA